MKLIDGTQVYHILQNLNNLEISFMEYSRSQKNFLKYDTYLEFFDNYIIKSQNLLPILFSISHGWQYNNAKNRLRNWKK